MILAIQELMSSPAALEWAALIIPPALAFASLVAVPD